MPSTKQNTITPGRGSLVQRLRLWSGVVLFLYVIGHFTNHALGLFSFNMMNLMLQYMSLTWGSLPGTIVLYSAFSVHILLGFQSILKIRTLKLPAWRWLQIILGLSIPYWLINHIIVTRGSEILTGVPVTYLQEFALLWPVAALKQNALLLIVWVHAMMGFHFWLRPHNWYKEGAVLILPLSFTLPILSIAGWITAAQRELKRVALDPAGPEAITLSETLDRVRPIVSEYGPPAQLGVLIMLGMLATLFVIFYLARMINPKMDVTYGKGKTVRARRGKTILDVSRDNNIPHMSVCGGRARCSTCRVAVVSDEGGLSEPNATEKNLLKRINAASNVRLACQAQITGNVELRPIIPFREPGVPSQTSDTFGWGVESQITVFHLKIINFLPLIDRSLPYDAVFILNHFLDQMVGEVERQGGHVDKFTNDGLVALFGLETNNEDAVKASLTAAVNCHHLSRQRDDILEQHLDHALSIGIGVHTDKAIIGRDGNWGEETVPGSLTAIGNVTGIAEAFSKVTEKLGACLVYSLATHEIGNIGNLDIIGKRSRIRVEGISEEVEAVILKNSGSLRKLLKNGSPA